MLETKSSIPVVVPLNPAGVIGFSQRLKQTFYLGGVRHARTDTEEVLMHARPFTFAGLTKLYTLAYQTTPAGS